jgi:D-alanyl-D-alanine carboxypeptidase (penicillin-binding protein 5/6)
MEMWLENVQLIPRKRRKRWWALLCMYMLCMGLLSSVMTPHTFGEQQTDELTSIVSHAKSAILMDADTGTIMLEKNKDTKLPPASITKVMTMLLIMEAIEQGKLTMSDQVRTSEYAASMGGSQIFLQVGEQMSVQDMLKGIALASGNDASVAMAEHLAGSEALFVEMMNQRAAQLGMVNTRFANCNGLPHDDHYTTAYDIALMSQALLKHETITSFTGVYQDYLRKDSTKPFWLVNTNKLVRFYTGADGLKTGYTGEAKYCLSATARRDQLRVIAVVLGEPDSKTRQSEIAKMFDYAFAQYFSYPIIRKGETFAELRIPNGVTASIPLIAQQDYALLLKKGDNLEGIRYEMQFADHIRAPLTAAQPMGTLIIYQHDQVKREITIACPATVAEAGWWMRCTRFVRKMLWLD